MGRGVGELGSEVRGVGLESGGWGRGSWGRGGWSWGMK